ncbi:MAG: cytochrome b [Phenylobacterium sp.]|jgi:cytochrome b561|uniref:cytochrome b n=1 Tax=Phenylobacterium sp. TaxID=1871053 RepID=UPI003918A8FD
MPFANTRQAYGWVAIALHWISAGGVIALYLLGERMEEASDRAERLAALDTHVSVGLLLFTFLAARLIWSFSQPHPESLERNPWLRRAALGVHLLFLLMILLLIVSGPLTVWSAGRDLAVFDWFTIPSPTGRVDWLHEAGEVVHKAASKLFWPLIALHVAGALKHLVVDRDRTLMRMLRARG